MTGKVTRGRGFRGACRYLCDPRHDLEPERQPEIIGGNMAGRDSRELTREFGSVRQLRPDIEKPVEHVSLNFPRDERHLSNEEMARIADDFVRRRGYDPARCQYVVVRHHDKDHAHCHLLLNRIRTDGTLVPQQHREYHRIKEVCRALERDYGLRQISSRRIEGRERERIHERTPTRGEQRMQIDRGVSSEKEQLKQIIREAAKGRPTMTEFLRRLEERRVQVRPNMAENGRVSGISYKLDHVAVKGSQLGRGYSWAGLQRQQSVRYDPVRDRPALNRAARATIGHEPLPQVRAEVRSRLEQRLPLLREARAILRAARDIERTVRSPGRAAMNIAARVLPAPVRTALNIARKVIDLGRER